MRGRLWLAPVIDLILVLVFVIIGRGSHDEAFSVFGTLSTWWPFLGGLAIGWAVVTFWRRPFAIVWTGIVLWVATVAVGMLLRIVSGQSAAWSFVIVAAVVLGVLLIGWRAIAQLVLRARARQDRVGHDPVSRPTRQRG